MKRAQAEGRRWFQLHATLSHERLKNMRDAMTSGERVNAAIELKELDRVPIVFRTIQCMDYHWRGPIERANYLLALGCDDMLQFALPECCSPQVKTRVWTEDARPYPILHKEWSTPAGKLHASVYVTDDWRVDDVPLYSDHAWSRGLDFPVKSREDFAALDHILYDPFRGVSKEYRRTCEELVRSARQIGVAVWGIMSPSPLYAMGFIGGKRSMFASVDEPEFFQELITRVGRWSRRGMEWLIDLGVDCIYRSGCYETVDLFSPDAVRRLFMPELKADVELAHHAGVKLHNFAQTGVMPFLDDYAAMGLDLLSSLDPAGSNPTDLAEVKRRIGNKVALMGGVENRELFERSDPEKVKAVVKHTLEVLAPGGGYILSTAGTIMPHAKEENVLAFIEAGLQYGRYPPRT